MITVNSADDRLDPATISSLLGAEVTAVEHVDSGRNSKVFKVTTVTGSYFAAKLYSGTTADGRSRLTAEYSNLQFLRANGIDDVPEAVQFDEANEFALYEFIEGEKVQLDEVNASDIDQATDFLLRLHQAKLAPDAAGIAPASEACFSLAEISRSVQSRFQRLSTKGDGGPLQKEMTGFLTDQLKPDWDGFLAWSADRLSSDGPDQSLEQCLRTLSPSDFGFHNCLRKADGTLVFLDLEHFGWDDPAKMISDFLLHPAMEIEHQLKQQFLSNILDGLKHSDRLANRIKAVYPLFGVKWCLILLNEFQTDNMRRRRLAGNDSASDSDIQAEQLVKARNMLNKVKTSYREFPYHD